MFFERFWRTVHHLTIKGGGPLFFLVAVFLVLFAYEPSAMAYLGQEVPQSRPTGGTGLLAQVLLGTLAGLFVLCPLVSLICLRRSQHRRGVIVLFPPMALSLAALSSWLL